jgi:putative transposase
MPNRAPSYRGCRLPAEIVSHAVWLYYRSYLSFRDAEDLLARRGATVTYEAIRQERTIRRFCQCEHLMGGARRSSRVFHLIITDGFEFYEKVVCRVFGPAVLYGQVLKTRRNDRVVKVERRARLRTVSRQRRAALISSVPSQPGPPEPRAGCSASSGGEPRCPRLRTGACQGLDQKTRRP